MKKLIRQVIGGILGIYLAQRFVPGVVVNVLPESKFFSYKLTEKWQVISVIGATLGLVYFFIKPLIDKLTLPLKLLTFGLFSLILNMAILWFLDVLFSELEISSLFALFKATLICWGISFLLR